MKFFIISMLISMVAMANNDMGIKIQVKVEQNIKALYRDINLTKEQEDYIVSSEDSNIKIISRILVKEAYSKINMMKNIDDKNVVQFELDKNGNIENVKIISNSENKELDKITKSTIEKINNQSLPLNEKIAFMEEINQKLMLPKEKITLRYIFRYEVKNKNIKTIYQNNDTKNTHRKNEIYINRGTNHFKYDSKEYTRVFTTNEDGFINVSQEPNACAKRITILTEKGQNFAEASGYLFSRINKEAPKGKYEILIQTAKDCNINLQYQ